VTLADMDELARGGGRRDYDVHASSPRRRRHRRVVTTSGTRRGMEARRLVSEPGCTRSICACLPGPEADRADNADSMKWLASIARR
jgi:hypothetical protein